MTEERVPDDSAAGMQDEAAEVRRIWAELGLPGVIDVHTHFMPKSVMDKVCITSTLRVHCWVVNGRSPIG